MNKDKIIRLLCTLFFVVSLIPTVYYGYKVYEERKVAHENAIKLEKIRELTASEPEIKSEEKTEPSKIETKENKEEPILVESKPVNIETLQEQINPNIYSWIRIPGTNIDEPVLQNQSSNDYYLERDMYDEWSALGSIFFDKDSSTDMSDTVTYIYGHNVYNDTKFTHLENYLDNQFLNSNNLVEIHSKNNTIIKYEIIGATLIPPVTELYPNEKFTQENIKDIKVHLSNSGINSDSIKDTDKLLFLITCENFNNSERRTLVVAKRIN